MKKFVILLIFILCASLLCGCVTVSAERRINKDSSIEDIVTVKFDKDEVNSYGYSVEYVKEKITKYFNLNGYEVVSSEGECVIGRKYYPTHADFKERTEQQDTENIPTRDGFFFDVYENQSASPFSGAISQGFPNKILEDSFPLVDESKLDEVVYEYRYSTPYANITSDGERIEGELYTHYWKFSALEAEHSTITITQTVPDQTGWYLVALIAVAVIVATGFGIIAYKKSKKGEEDDG